MLQVGMVSDKAGVNRLLKAWLVIRVVPGDGSTHLLLRAHMELRKSLQERSSAIAAAYLGNQFLCWQENTREFRVRSREWECGRDRYHLGAVGVRTWCGWVKGTAGHGQPELEQRWTAGRPGLPCGLKQCFRTLLCLTVMNHEDVSILNLDFCSSCNSLCWGGVETFLCSFRCNCCLGFAWSN